MTASSRYPAWLMAVLAVVALLAGVVIWTLTDPVPPPQATEPSSIHIASEAEIAAHRTDRLTVFRLRENPRILILDYPTLVEQGMALNRLAAFIEKADAPKDLVLDDAGLAQALAKSGDTIESYYYGHDYAVADIQRFFTLAERDGIRLNPSEQVLRALVSRSAFANPAQPHAIITIPQIGGDVVDGLTRRIILRHELAHGAFFTNPAYAAHVRAAWTHLLTEAERWAFLRFLRQQGYDTSNVDLVVNEMQALLGFTPDSRAISAERLGLTPDDYARLRQRFLAGIEDAWLRRLADAPLP